MDICVLHDLFSFPGGGERVATDLARNFLATLRVGHVTDSMFDSEYFDNIRLENLGAFEMAPILSRFSKTLALAKAFKKMPPLNGDAAIFSGALSLLGYEAVKGKKIWYCHTPPRLLFDKKQYYIDKCSLLKRPALLYIMAVYRRAFVRAANAMDCIVTNSQTVSMRVDKYLGLPSTVVYPPCDIASYNWRGHGDYYLSTARVDELKRVVEVVKAFCSMPDQRLIVVSGGSELEKVKRMAAGFDNIQVMGWVDDGRLKELVGKCRATIYIPQDEDFGISPVESMAAGKPVIGVNEGGVRETIVDNKTGILIKKIPGVGDIKEAVYRMTSDRALSMREACVKRAGKFDSVMFKKRMLEVVSGCCRAGCIK